MARLQDEAGRYFVIAPLRYQFEDLERERSRVERKNQETQRPLGRGRIVLTDTDANWLVVRIEVSDGEDQWVETDPAFLVEELQKLVVWMRDRAEGVPDTELGYGILEQLLELRSEATENGLRLHATFFRRFRPQRPHAQTGPYVIELQPTADSMRRFADELEEELRSFPPRRVS